MKLLQIPLVALLVAVVALPAVAQQQEINTPGGWLQSGGVDPIVGSPFLISPSNGSIDFTVGGTPGAPYALFAGPLAANSIPLTTVANQFFDLDLAGTTIVGNGIAGGGALPDFLFVLDSQGTSSWSFPVSPSAVGLSVALQAGVFDASLPPFNLNFSAAAEFSVDSRFVLSGDETADFTFPSGPYPMYGSSFSSVSVSTAGYLVFGGGAAPTSDFNVSRASFLSGSVGAAPMPAPVVSVMWNFALLFGGSGSEVVVEEIAPFVTRIDYNNPIDFFTGALVGSYSCTLDASSGAMTITMDFTNLVSYAAAATGLTREICGVSDGGTSGASILELDLATGGTTNPVSPSSSSCVFQEFGSSSAIMENFDLTGVVLQFVDVTGAGDFILL